LAKRTLVRTCRRIGGEAPISAVRSKGRKHWTPYGGGKGAKQDDIKKGKKSYSRDIINGEGIRKPDNVRPLLHGKGKPSPKPQEKKKEKGKRCLVCTEVR